MEEFPAELTTLDHFYNPKLYLWQPQNPLRYIWEALADVTMQFLSLPQGIPKPLDKEEIFMKEAPKT